jgi:hypothetical protein
MVGGIELLRTGFAAFEKHVKKRKASIQERLKRKERVDDEDSAWLDGPANLIDEQRALELLENASDYEQALSRLGDGLQAAVQRMKEFAAGMKSSVIALKMPSAKRKSACSPINLPSSILNT